MSGKGFGDGSGVNNNKFMKKNFYTNSFDTRLFELVFRRKEKWIRLFDRVLIDFSEALNLGTGVFSKKALSLTPVLARYNGLSFQFTSKQVRQSFTF